MEIWNLEHLKFHCFKLEGRTRKIELKYAIWQRLVISNLDSWNMNFTDFFAMSHPKMTLENARALEFIKVKIKIER